MIEVKEITSFSTRPLRNGEQYNFIVHFLELLEDKAEGLKLSEPFSALQDSFEVEQLILKQPQSSALSPKIASQSKRVLDVYSYLRGVSTQQNRSPVKEISAAGERLFYLFTNYGELSGRSYGDINGLVNALLDDIKVDYYQEAIETLNLKSAFDQLATENALFTTLYNSRTVDEGKVEDVPKMTEIRPIVQDKYAFMVKALNALWLIRTLIPDETFTMMEDLEHIINTMNARIKKEQDLLARRGEGSSKSDDKDKVEIPDSSKDPDKEEEEKPDQSEKPTDPEEPQDPDKDDEEGGGTHFEPVE